MGALVDGASSEALARDLLEGLRSEARIDAADGHIVCEKTAILDRIEEAGEPRLMSAEQSNASIAFGDSVVLKLYRRLREGVQPDTEIARFLTSETDFAHAPRLLGTIDWVAEDGAVTTLAAASEYVPNQGDAWTYATEMLHRQLSEPDSEATAPDEDAAAPPVGPFDLGAVLGTRTAELHLAMASGAPGTAFASEAMRKEDVAALVETASEELSATMDRLRAARGDLPADARYLAEDVLDRQSDLAARIAQLRDMIPAGRMCRIHGDYHLGQVLIVRNDVMIIDFEGEPGRSLSERQAKTCPLRDVAGMMRSFDYALWTALRRGIEAGGDAARAAAMVESWRAATQGAFLDAYRDRMGVDPLYPQDRSVADALLDFFMIHKAAYEIDYELAMRPGWVEIPLRGLQAILDDERSDTGS